MINLLPPQEKETILREEKKRLTTILWFLFFVFLFCLILILFSVESYLGGQVEAQKILTAQQEKEFNDPETQAIKEKINAANLILAKLDVFYESQINFGKILEDISETMPEGMYLINLSINRSAADKMAVQISLSGLSSTREILFNFKKNLEGRPEFKEINFPSSSWVKPADINFNVSFKMVQGL